MQLHEDLAILARQGISHLAIEASSHGLDQHRLDGLRLSAACFTNLTHEHLDYHPSMDAYFDAKARLSNVTPLASNGALRAIGARALATSAEVQSAFTLSPPQVHAPRRCRRTDG